MPVETRTIQQAYKFALDPTPRQEREFMSHVGGARYAYNWGLDQVSRALDARQAEKDAGAGKPTTKVPGHFDLCKAWTAYKNEHAADPEPEPGERRTNTAWVPNNFVGTYQAALRDAAVAWKNFFDSRTGKRAGRGMGRPRYKSRHKSKKTFQVHGETLQVPGPHHVKLPKIGLVKTHESTRKLRRRLVKGTARIVRGTVSQDSWGRWHIALTVEVERQIRTGPSLRQRTGGAIGVDFGVRDIATLSTGQIIGNPRHLEASLDKLAAVQRAYARTEKGSKRREKARRKVARCHARIRQQRLDGIHQATTALIHTHEKIAVEGWDVAQVLATGSDKLPARVRRDRNRALADTGVGLARWQLQSKAAWYGATIVATDKNTPTGRTCGACGQVRTNPVPPAHELFHCPSCGHSAPRRLNTARVLAGMAVNGDASSGGESQNARGGDVRPKGPRSSGQSPTKREARTQRKRRGQTGTPGP